MAKVCGFALVHDAAADLTVVAGDAALWFEGERVPADARIISRGDQLAVAFKADDDGWTIRNAASLVATPLETEDNGLLVIQGAELRLATFGTDPTCWRADASPKFFTDWRRDWWADVMVEPLVKAMNVPTGTRPHGKGKPLELAIIGEIGGGRYRGMAEQIRDADDRSIVLTVDSPGGSADEGLDIHRALVRHPHRVEVEIIGRAESAAAIIALAGDVRRIAPDGRMMLHQVSVAGFSGATAEDLRAHADRMDRMNANLAAIVHHATRCGPATARAWIDAETTFDAGRAITAGLAHSLINDRPSATPSAPKARFAPINGPYRSTRPASALPPLYSHSGRYKAGQKVRHDGKVYVATRNTFHAPGLQPGAGPDWERV